jgi:hypothetical protein
MQLAMVVGLGLLAGLLTVLSWAIRQLMAVDWEVAGLDYGQACETVWAAKPLAQAKVAVNEASMQRTLRQQFPLIR